MGKLRKKYPFYWIHWFTVCIQHRNERIAKQNETIRFYKHTAYVPPFLEITFAQFLLLAFSLSLPFVMMKYIGNLFSRC
ncbi:hypothetical protein [Paenibacillus taiwanensis]|uniref:hypothetical protein n=1 Tax=Paenibacillus taiwanensis TaxID=401638 RepID=UPI0012FC49A6|nr:hypothetical protein [Paenibacillus taiwanensis]